LVHTPPSPQVSWAQQRWPGPPHCSQVPPPLHTSENELHVSFAQHGCPAAPHWAQVPP
jgi:hypothetical protein